MDELLFFLIVLNVGMTVLYFTERRYANKMKAYAKEACSEWKKAVDRHRADKDTFVGVRAMQDEWAEVIGD